MPRNVDHHGTPMLPKGLPLELWKLVLNFIEPDHDQAVPIDIAIASRQFLSVESFVPPDPRDSTANVGRITIRRLRLVCRAFAGICAPSLFGQFVLRFSPKDLQRLDYIARSPHLAPLVTRLTYMVPFFYHECLDSLEDFSEELRRSGLRNLNRIREKADEQRSIINSRWDSQALGRAIPRFSSLQLVKLLPCTDHEDRIVLEYLSERIETRSQVHSIWTWSLSHAGHTVGIPWLASSPAELSRFILPFTTLGSLQFLRLNSPSNDRVVAERLTCLTLHFTNSEDLNIRARDLAELFHAIFTKATKMKAVHIGFPPQSPLTLSLESVFQNVVWQDLVAFGVQGWELEDSEIIAFLDRHKNRLRGVRLRDVHLKDGSSWKRVLSFMREELRHLEWLSLRRVGYATYQHFLQEGAGVDMTMINISDSESTDESSDWEEEPNEELDSNGDPGDQEDLDEESDAEHGPHADDLEFPTFDLDTPASVWCSCRRGDDASTLDTLDDTDEVVSNAKRKAWEKWVLRRCPEHDAS